MEPGSAKGHRSDHPSKTEGLGKGPPGTTGSLDNHLSTPARLPRENGDSSLTCPPGLSGEPAPPLQGLGQGGMPTPALAGGGGGGGVRARALSEKDSNEAPPAYCWTPRGASGRPLVSTEAERAPGHRPPLAVRWHPPLCLLGWHQRPR